MGANRELGFGPGRESRPNIMKVCSQLKRTAQPFRILGVRDVSLRW